MNNKSNKTDTLPIIGKVTIKNLDALKEWNDSGEAVEFKTENWSEKRAKHWENSEQIGFYNLQNKIPQLNTAFDNVTGYHCTDSFSWRKLCTALSCFYGSSFIR